MYLDKGFFMSFHHRVHRENFHKEDVVFHCISEGKPLNNQDQGILKLVIYFIYILLIFVMDSKTDELMGVGMKGA